MKQPRVLKNDIGQVIDIGSLIVYPKNSGTLVHTMTPGVVVNIQDKGKRSLLVIVTPASLNHVRLSRIGHVIVVDRKSLNLSRDWAEIIDDELKAFAPQQNAIII